MPVLKPESGRYTFTSILPNFFLNFFQNRFPKRLGNQVWIWNQTRIQIPIVTSRRSETMCVFVCKWNMNIFLKNRYSTYSVTYYIHRLILLTIHISIQRVCTMLSCRKKTVSWEEQKTRSTTKERRHGWTHMLFPLTPFDVASGPKN